MITSNNNHNASKKNFRKSIDSANRHSSSKKVQPLNTTATHTFTSPNHPRTANFQKSLDHYLPLHTLHNKKRQPRIIQTNDTLTQFSKAERKKLPRNLQSNTLPPTQRLPAMVSYTCTMALHRLVVVVGRRRRHRPSIDYIARAKITPSVSLGIFNTSPRSREPSYVDVCSRGDPFS